MYSLKKLFDHKYLSKLFSESAREFWIKEIYAKDNWKSTLVYLCHI